MKKEIYRHRERSKNHATISSSHQWLATFSSHERGFTLVEYILVMGIFAILAGLSTLNLANTKHTVSLTTTVDTLVSDLGEQQLKAMIGDTQGSDTVSNYGIHFGTNSYTLFRDTYGTSNFVVNLGDQIQVGTPGAEVVFLKGNGEVGNTFQVTLKDTTNTNKKTVTLNRYGVVTGIN